MIFSDRREAGRLLAERLKEFEDERPIIIGLPRGGVPVAFEVAQSLKAPLDIAVIRKVGHPLQPEYGIGAMSEDDFVWMNPEAAKDASLGANELEQILITEANEIRRRVELYRSGEPPISVEGRTAIIVDDGLATGVSARAAAHLMKARGAARVVLAVPVAAPDSVEAMEREGVVDEVICLEKPHPFFAVGQWYQDFSQTTDEEVRFILKQAKTAASMYAPSRGGGLMVSEEVTILEAGSRLNGLLTIPRNAKGIVLFAHGSGSSRFSPRNTKVARTLNDAGFATLLFDLLSEEEAASRELVFDIPLLAERLRAATQYIHERSDLLHLPIGYFGASTGAGAALVAAANSSIEIAAIVSRGGRPDLAGPLCREVKAPTLLIVGGDDEPVIELNESVIPEMPHADLVVIPGATHLFEEPGTLEAVANHAISWFSQHMKPARRKIAA